MACLKFWIEKVIFSHFYKYLLYDESYTKRFETRDCKNFTMSITLWSLISAFLSYTIYRIFFFSKDFPNEPCRLRQFFSETITEEMKENDEQLYVFFINAIFFRDTLKLHSRERIMKEKRKVMDFLLPEVPDAFNSLGYTSYRDYFVIMDIRLNKKEEICD